VIKRCILIVLLCIVSLQSPLYAIEIDIYATGGWTNLVINSSHLRGGAGSNLADSFESTVDATIISIAGTECPCGAWDVLIRKSASSWASGATLYVKRTGNGSGAGSIRGGTLYIAVGESDVLFFSGNGDKTNISIQYKISGLSISAPQGTYSAPITFTVVDQS
jgi:hypothetical protein